MDKFVCKHPWSHFKVNNPNGDGLTDFDAAVEPSVPFIDRIPENHDSPFLDPILTITDLTRLDRALEKLAA